MTGHPSPGLCQEGQVQEGASSAIPPRGVSGVLTTRGPRGRQTRGSSDSEVAEARPLPSSPSSLQDAIL